MVTPALYIPPCTCGPASVEPGAAHLPDCPHFDSMFDAPGPPPEGDVFTAIREKYRERDTRDL